MPKSPVPKNIRDKYIQEGLTLRSLNQPQPDLEYNGERYFLDNKGAKHGGWRLRNRSSHSAQGAKRRAQTQNAALTLEDYQSALGPIQGSVRFQADKALLRRIWASRGTPNMDVDHIHSLASGGLEHPNNFRLQQSSQNRSEGARTLTPAQKNALMLTENKIDQIRLQGPKVTPKQRQKILKSKGGGVRINPSSLSLFGGMTGGYTGADSMPRRVEMDPFGTGATIMLP